MSAPKPTRTPLSRAALKAPSGDERARRRNWLLLALALLLIPICLCVASQLALYNLGMNQANEDVVSRLAADYATWQPDSFNPLRPELIGTIRADQLTFAANSPALGTLVPFLPGPGSTQVANLPTGVTLTAQPSTTADTPTTTPTATNIIIFFPATNTPTLSPVTATAAATVTPPPPLPTSAPTLSLPQANLSITKTDGVAALNPGDGLTYTIVVTNNGPANVNNALVQDAFPAAILTASWTCAASAGSLCDTPVGAGNINHTVDLLSGGTATFTVTVTTDSAASGVLSNTATVTPPANRVDPNMANNTATDADTFNSADLEITKTGSASMVMFGDTFSYTITVTNHGPNTATNVIVTDTLSQVNWPPVAAASPSVSLLTFAPNPNGCAGFPCNLGSIPNGGSATITFRATANTAGPITNAVAVSADQADPGAFANADSELTDVRHKVVIELFWYSSNPPPPASNDTTADLDLIIIDPSGQTVARSTLCDGNGMSCFPALFPSFGEFSEDINCDGNGTAPTLPSNNETAFWTSVGGPASPPAYSITANYYETCAGSGTITWTVTVTVDNVAIVTPPSFNGSATGSFPSAFPFPAFTMLTTTCTIGATVSCP